jgi:hypothetical protein
LAEYADGFWCPEALFAKDRVANERAVSNVYTGHLPRLTYKQPIQAVSWMGLIARLTIPGGATNCRRRKRAVSAPQRHAPGSRPDHKGLHLGR